MIINEQENPNKNDNISERERRIKEIVEKNLEVNQEILKLTKYIKKYVFWQKIFGWLKTILIVVPIVLAIIYLPPFLKNFQNSLQELIGSFNVMGDSKAK